MTALSFSELKIDQLTIEYRYPNAYYLWDNAGHIWSEVAAVFGPLTTQNIAPNNVTQHAMNRFSLHVGLDKSFLIDHQPARSFDESCELHVLFFEAVTSLLKIRDISRIGTRILYVKEYETLAKAADVMKEFRLASVPTEKLFGVSAEQVRPVYHLEVSDENLGYNFKLLSRSETTKFEPPPEVSRLEAKEVVTNGVLLDIDLYTKKMVRVDSLDLQEHLSKWRRGIHRDMDKLLRLGQSHG
jgi:hypothetical protein